MMDFCIENDGFCIENDELCINLELTLDLDTRGPPVADPSGASSFLCCFYAVLMLLLYCYMLFSAVFCCFLLFSCCFCTVFVLFSAVFC